MERLRRGGSLRERGASSEGKLPRHTPPGTGEHTVGIVDVMSDPGQAGCFIRLYYPAEKADIMARDKQWPRWLPRKQYGAGYVYFLSRNTKIFGRVFNWLGGDVYVPGLWKHSVLLNGSKFPVVIFSHGIGGNRTTYTTVCCELASQGFVVAALEHRDGSSSFTYCLHDNENNNVVMENPSEKSLSFHRSNSFTEEFRWFEKIERWDDFTHRNKQMYIRASECQRALDLLQTLNNGQEVHNILHEDFDLLQFKNRLDLGKASLIGHSFGGATCICTLAKDKRFKVGIVLDGWMHPLDDEIYSSPTQPILFINTETFHWEKNTEQMKQLLTEGVERRIITIRGTCHQSQTDFQFLINKPMGRFLSVRHTLSPRIAMDLNNKAMLGFLWKHLGIKEELQHQDILEGNHEHVIKGIHIVRKVAPSS
ncbi:platelet-activating factor acetylhydrolase 2, cytoplasmic-like [Liolophura sinensis]|uniref:platelet-activating factor acetylhydrolase 2, cytoplasmic-like n=1 Tax=Liolophura sinensis TaxID=3198878 RepID=UPI0031590B45